MRREALVQMWRTAAAAAAVGVAAASAASAAGASGGQAPWPFGQGDPVAVIVGATAAVERGHAAMDTPWPFGNGDPAGVSDGRGSARPALERDWVVRFVGLPGVVAPVVLPAGSGAVAVLMEGREPWLATAR